MISRFFTRPSGVILGQHADSLDMRVRHVAQRKINTSVAACHRHRADRALLGQFSHLAVIAAC